MYKYTVMNHAVNQKVVLYSQSDSFNDVRCLYADRLNEYTFVCFPSDVELISVEYIDRTLTESDLLVKFV